MKRPVIKIDDKQIKAETPKTKLWRKIIAFNKDYSETNMAEDIRVYDAMLEILADAFGNDVTPDIIEDYLPIDELVPLFHEVTNWISELIGRKLDMDLSEPVGKR